MYEDHVGPRIVIVEPSMFRRDETYVCGPYGRLRAWWVAHWECWRHPYALVQIVSATSTITMGERVLWDPKKP